LYLPSPEAVNDAERSFKMLIRTPHSLHYPITLVKVEKRVGDSVTRDDDLFLYSYTTKVKQGSRYEDEEEEVDKTLMLHFQSPYEGTIKSWRIWEGDTLTKP